MAPEIKIVEGPEAGVTVPLAGMVCRLGSSTACDLLLPGEASLAVVVRSKENERLVYNRSDCKIVVGRKTVRPGQFARWRAGQKLRLASGVVLVWNEASTDSKPTQVNRLQGNQSAAVDRTIGSAFAEEIKSTTVEETSRSRLRLVTGLMLLFALYLFGTDSANSLDKSAVALHNLIEELVEKSPASDPRLQYIRILVQRGRAANLHGDSDKAQEQYVKARTLLKRPRDISDPLANNPVVARLEKNSSTFVVSQLRQMNY